MSNLPVLVDKAREILSPDEQLLVEKYANGGGYPVAKSTAISFFELYLRGSSCEEIQKINPGFKLGAILLARVEHDWDKIRDEYTASTQELIRRKVQSAQLEAVGMVSTMLSVAAKVSNEKYQRFLQTGDETELKGAMTIDNINSMVRMSETLLKLTGQDAKKGTSVNVNVSTSGNGVSNTLETDAITPKQAAKLLEILEDAEDAAK